MDGVRNMANNYQCKTYQGENRKYLKSVPYGNLKKAFMENVSYERCFQEIVDFLDDENKKLLQKFMVKILSNPNDFTIAELQEMMKG